MMPGGSIMKDSSLEYCQAQLSLPSLFDIPEKVSGEKPPGLFDSLSTAHSFTPVLLLTPMLS